MSVNPIPDPHGGWTFESLKAYVDAVVLRLDQRADDAHAAVAAALVSAEKAVDKAEAATGNRFEAVNEFRAQLADQASRFLPRVEYDTTHRETERQIDIQRTALDELRRQVAVGSPDVKDLLGSRAETAGEQAAASRTRALLFAGIGLALTFIIAATGIVVAILTHHAAAVVDCYNQAGAVIACPTTTP